MTIAKMVREMIEKGVDPDVIELAVATAEEVMSDRVSGGIPVDAAAEKRRAYDRERKKKLRGIPPESTGHPRNSENASLSKEEKKEDIPEREAPKRNVRGHRLPEDWHPSADDWNEATAKLGQPGATLELSKFRDHWKQQPGSKGVKLDWDAAWRNWVRRAAEYRGGLNGHSHSNNRTSGTAGQPQTSADAVLAGMGRLAARVRERQLAERQHGLDLAGGDGPDGFAEGDGAGAHRRFS